MSSKRIHFNDDAQEQIVRGALLAAKTVATTYGPHGRTCILDRMAGMLSTKDGVTVAREISFADPVENLGAEALKAACIKVNDDVGDGTTSAAVLTGALLEGGRKVIVARAHPMQVAAGIQAAGVKAAQAVQDLSVAVKDQAVLEEVAAIASNGDREVAKLMAEACMAVGKDGSVVIEDGNGIECKLTFKEGMEISQGMISPAFLTGSGASERVFERPVVAVINKVLGSMADVGQILGAAVGMNTGLVLIAPDVTGEALAAMAINNQRGVLQCVAIRAPGGAGGRQDEYLRDIAALTGADYVDSVAGYDHTKWQPDWFGSLKQATVGLKTSVFVAHEEAADSIEQRLVEIRGQEERCTSDYDRDRLRERKAKLTGGLAIIEIGGVTEAAMKERRARVEDALGAVQAALRNGIVPGAGTAYIRASQALDALPLDKTESFLAGWKILGDALRRPTELLVDNAGLGIGKVLVHQVLTAPDKWSGWDARSNEVRDLRSAPRVVDPTSVAVSVIETACSLAATLLTAGASITSVPSA